jgi:hypothetical protein
VIGLLSWLRGGAKLPDYLVAAARIIADIIRLARDARDFRRRMHEAVDRGDFDDVVFKAKKSDAELEAFLRSGR